MALILSFLGDWLIRHIMHEDMKYRGGDGADDPRQTTVEAHGLPPRAAGDRQQGAAAPVAARHACGNIRAAS